MIKSANNKVAPLANTAPEGLTETPTESASTELVEGMVGGVNHYHCATAAGENDALDVVLLHGASFSKENWKHHGILDTLCEESKLSITALNLATLTGGVELQNVLDAMQTEGMIQTDKPVALVTPSASGWTVINWIGTDTGLLTACSTMLDIGFLWPCLLLTMWARTS